MRIAVLCEYFHPDNSGGTPTDLSELARVLKDSRPDLELDVLTSRNLYRPAGLEGPLVPREDWGGVKIERLRTPKSNRAGMAFRLAAGTLFSMAALCRLLTRRRYDLLFIVTNPPANGLAAWIYRRLRGVPYVYLVHDLYPDIAVAMGQLRAGSPVERILRAAQGLWLRGAKRVVVLGRCMSQHLARRYGLAPEQLRVIPSWADPAAIRPGPRQNDWRARHDLAGFVVLYAGNFSHYVNFDQILAAARRLAGTPEICFALVGDGVRRGELEARVAQDGLRNVRILPKVPRAAMPEVLAGADAALVSLEPRMLGLGVPSKLYTILASGRPVVAVVPEGCEVARVLAEARCGLNVAGGDDAGLAAAVLKLRDDPALAARMGASARAVLEEKYTAGQAARQFEAVFREAAGPRTKTHT